MHHGIVGGNEDQEGVLVGGIVGVEPHRRLRRRGDSCADRLPSELTTVCVKIASSVVSSAPEV